ncbi:hypothetical protein B0H15DRAFT_803832 [Mycena belliarum]|uniref:Uncharacterized protein n=1 Tax=Mycena belliarum TaxID=1033014 RepID=A0AAD6TV89_9AGAR|nr:hypothetical protein B0H15DRAFT_803832 [Mycena belliae]
MSRAPSPDDDESNYNDGKGLEFTIELTLATTGKTRKNAKPKVMKKTIFLHEDSALNHLLYAAIKAFKREDDLSFSFNPRRDDYTSTTLDLLGMTYTIPKSNFKDMSLTCNSDYETLISHARKKDIPETIRIQMAELKTFEPTEAEIEQNRLIVQLNSEWKCEDRTCKRFICFPDRKTAKHVPLSHLHVQTWVAAIQGKVINDDGTAVDLKNPPDTKLFDHQEPDSEDQALIRNRTVKKDSGITINLTLPETAAPVPASRSLMPAMQPVAHPSHPRIAPQMSLELFSQRYNLSRRIFDKLGAYSVTGPQTLRHLKNNHLEEALLNPAEIADVRDAQDRWLMGEGE